MACYLYGAMVILTGLGVPRTQLPTPPSLERPVLQGRKARVFATLDSAGPSGWRFSCRAQQTQAQLEAAAQGLSDRSPKLVRKGFKPVPPGSGSPSAESNFVP